MLEAQRFPSPSAGKRPEVFKHDAIPVPRKASKAQQWFAGGSPTQLRRGTKPAGTEAPKGNKGQGQALTTAGPAHNSDQQWAREQQAKQKEFDAARKE